MNTLKMTNEEILNHWKNFDLCPDFTPLLESLVKEREGLRDTIVKVAGSLSELQGPDGNMYSFISAGYPDSGIASFEETEHEAAQDFLNKLFE